MRVPFPTMLICSQSIHSKKKGTNITLYFNNYIIYYKVRKFYPELSDSDIAFLYGFGVHVEKKMTWGTGCKF